MGLGNGNTSVGTVTESNGTGVYKVRVTVTDDDRPRLTVKMEVGGRGVHPNGVRPRPDRCQAHRRHKLNPYTNSDAAGTPQKFKPYLVRGATGDGGTSWTGLYSDISNVTP
jgi:hypothetical protein